VPEEGLEMFHSAARYLLARSLSSDAIHSGTTCVPKVERATIIVTSQKLGDGRS